MFWGGFGGFVVAFEVVLGPVGFNIEAKFSFTMPSEAAKKAKTCLMKCCSPSPGMHVAANHLAAI
jgi:hypothetical protein